MVAANALADLLRWSAPYRRRCQFTLGRTFTALSRQFQGQSLRQETVLLRPTIGGQVIDDA